MNVQQALTRLVPLLAPHSETPRLEAQVLAAHVLEKTRTWVMAHPEADLRPDQVLALEQAAAKLEAGVPLPYVLGRWEFYGLDLVLTPEVLIPRPETELLVEHALQWLDQHPGPRLAVDVGTGSGCIAAAITANNPNVRFIATDISPAALQVARTNLRRLRLAERVHLVQSDLLPPARAQFDLICANLPYIDEETVKTLPIYGREPTLALTPGLDGLALIRRLLASAPPRLAPGGAALLEFEAYQGERVLELARAAFPQAHARLVRDLSGRERLLRIDTPGG
jgi:release factor glutamine methyltransferase